jgi:hypothetical protein
MSGAKWAGCVFGWVFALKTPKYVASYVAREHFSTKKAFKQMPESLGMVWFGRDGKI